MCAKLPRAAPPRASLLGYYRGGIFPLWRGGDQRGEEIAGRRCYRRPAGVGVSSREENRSWRTNSAASHVASVALVIYPPESTARTENFQTSGRSAAFGESSPICSRRRFFIQTEQRPSVLKKLGDDAISKQSAPLLLCRSPPHRVRGKQTSERTLRAWGNRNRVRRGHFGSIRIAFSPAAFPAQEKKIDVLQPIKKSRRSCRVAISPYEKTNRSGRKICAMRHFRRVAVDNSPRELTRQSEQEPIMAKQLDRGPPWRCRLRYLSGGVGRPYGEKTN